MFRHTELDKPRKDKRHERMEATAKATAGVAAKEAEAARRFADERRKGFDEGFEQGVAFAREVAEEAARATAEEAKQQKAAQETRHAATQRFGHHTSWLIWDATRGCGVPPRQQSREAIARS